MRIGVDARALAGPRDGIGTFEREMLMALVKVASQHEYYLYAHRDFSLPIESALLHKRVGSGPMTRWGTAWLHWAVPTWAQQDDLDIFWGAAHVLPGRLPTWIKSVVTIHDLVFRECPATMPWPSRVVHRQGVPRALRHADTVVAVSVPVGQELTEHYGTVVTGKLSVIPEGVDYERFARIQDLPDVQAVQKKYNIGEHYLLSVGTLEPRKNYELLVRAYEEDEFLNKNVLLVIAGRVGWKISGLLVRIKKSPVSKNIRLIQDATDQELRLIYGHARTCVFTSHYEGCGLPVLEALASGRPVVVPDVPWARDTAGAYGHYYEQGNTQSLREQIILSMGQPLATEPPETFFTERSWAKAAQRYLDVFSRLKI